MQELLQTCMLRMFKGQVYTWEESQNTINKNQTQRYCV